MKPTETLVKPKRADEPPPTVPAAPLMTRQQLMNPFDSDEEDSPDTKSRECGVRPSFTKHLYGELASECKVNYMDWTSGFRRAWLGTKVLLANRFVVQRF